mmetsp:Transcript_2902/g.5749  ORF Transcript_2902/g.5749 Transcript_2902/m.5749 type:complete len:211 (+) Transcript_2902:113-745(+)
MHRVRRCEHRTASSLTIEQMHPPYVRDQAIGTTLHLLHPTLRFQSEMHHQSYKWRPHRSYSLHGPRCKLALEFIKRRMRLCQPMSPHPKHLSHFCSFSPSSQRKHRLVLARTPHVHQSRTEANSSGVTLDRQHRSLVPSKIQLCSRLNWTSFLKVRKPRHLQFRNHTRSCFPPCQKSPRTPAVQQVNILVVRVAQRASLPINRRLSTCNL